MIYFLRHGQTDYNAEHRTQGQLDIPLNNNGIMQATAIAEELKNYHFDHAFCSPLIRAKVTMEIINKYHKLKVIYDDRLKEFNCGIYQGKIKTEEERAKVSLDPHKYGAEDNNDVVKRVESFLIDIKNLQGKAILIVAHAGIYSAVNFIFKKRADRDAAYQRGNIKNAEVICFDF